MAEQQESVDAGLDASANTAADANAETSEIVIAVVPSVDGSGAASGSGSASASASAGAAMQDEFVSGDLLEFLRALQLQSSVDLDDDSDDLSGDAIRVVSAASNATSGSCRVCMGEADFCQTLPCRCACCQECCETYLSKKVQEGSVRMMTCPVCVEPISDEVIQAIVAVEVFERYTSLHQRWAQNERVRQDPNLCWCPTPDCSTVVTRKHGKTAQCTTCGLEFCFDCSSEPHKGQSCEQALKKLAKKSGQVSELEFAKWAKKSAKACPSCTVLIERDRGTDGENCNHMICSSCGCEWCWLCGRKIPPMGHFSELSVTGCPGLQFSGPDVQLGGRISARVRALRLRSRKAARISGAVVAGAAALPFMVVLGIAVGAYYGVRRLRRSTR